MKFVKYISLVLLFTMIFIKSQINPYSNITGSFDLSSINSDGLIDVHQINESTGQAEISIPLFMIKTGDIEYPINLFYNSSGIKVNQRASSVGLGWNLFLPQIAREIVDAKDMDDNAGTFGPKRVGYFTKLANDVKYDLSYRDQKKDQFNIDEFPDIFHVTLPKTTNAFFFENISKVKLLTQSRIIVEAFPETRIEEPQYPNKDFYNISIKDEEGVTYLFNETEICNFQFAENYFNDPGMAAELLPTISNWKITEISNIKGDHIKFEYEQANTYQTQNIYNVREVASKFYSKLTDFSNRSVTGYYYNLITPIADAYPGLHLKGFLDSGRQRAIPEQGKLPEYTYKNLIENYNYKRLSNLKKIKFRDGYVMFAYDHLRQDSKTDERALSSVTLYDFHDKIIKKYDFFYSYFDCVDVSVINTHDKTKRLRLDKIVDNAGKSYQFKYDDTPLPSLNSKAFDYGGFYNGTFEADGVENMADTTYFYPNQKEWSLLPFDVSNTDFHGENTLHKHVISHLSQGITREPNEKYAQAGVLKEIKNPYKGVQRFEYELNEFRLFSRQQKAPGLRIKKTEFIDKDTTLTTDFKYIESDGFSSGRMLSSPYIGYPKAQLFKAESIANPQDQWYPLYTDYNGLPNFESNHLGKLFKIFDKPSQIQIFYKNVEKSDGRGTVISEFTVNEELEMGMGNSFYIPMTYVSDFINGANINTYWAYVSYQEGIFRSSEYNFSAFLETNSAYKLRYKNPIIQSLFGKLKNQYVYDSKGKLKKELNIKYLNYHPNHTLSAANYFMKPIMHISSNAFLNNGESSGNHIIYSPQGEIALTYFYNNQIVDSKKEIDFLDNGNITTETRYGYALRSEHSMPNTHQFKKDANNYFFGEMFLYHNQADPNVVRNNLQTQITGVGDFGGYQPFDPGDNPYGPIASVNVSSAANIKTSNKFLPTKKESKSYTMENEFLSSTLLETYDLYDNRGNLLQYTNQSGLKTTILYGYRQSQPIAKLQGCGYVEVMTALGLSPASDPSSYLSSEIVTKSNLDKDSNTENALIVALDQLRQNESLSTCQITTYTYDPLIGVTSITSPGGQREVYIYNSANQLIEVRRLEKSSNGESRYPALRATEYNYKH